MAATFENLSFETQGVSPGLALGWDLEFQASLIRFAAYGEFPPRPDEQFDRAWDNSDFVFFLGDVNTERAIYGSFTEIDDNEKFESDWSNGGFSFSLGLTEEASYDTSTPESVEDFEEEWDSNENFTFVLGAVDDALYDASNENVEDFEEEWDFNDTRYKTFFVTLQATDTFAFVNSNPDTITRSSGDFLADQFRPNDGLVVDNSFANDGTFDIEVGIASVTADTLTLIASDSLTAEAAGPQNVRIRNFDEAIYDGSLDREDFEGTWDPL